MLLNSGDIIGIFYATRTQARHHFHITGATRFARIRHMKIRRIIFVNRLRYVAQHSLPRIIAMEMYLNFGILWKCDVVCKRGVPGTPNDKWIWHKWILDLAVSPSALCHNNTNCFGSTIVGLLTNYTCLSVVSIIVLLLLRKHMILNLTKKTVSSVQVILD